MSRIRADKFVNSGATGAPQLTFGAEVPVGYGITGAGGINITGVATAASFSGNATGLTGTPNISVGTISASGNVSIGGTLTYEDVTNIDSVGVITARKGIVATGVVTATSFSGSGANLTGVDSAPSFSGIASGSLTNGQAAALTDDGKIIAVSGAGVPVSIGSSFVFESAAVSYVESVYDSTNDRVVVAYQDAGNSNHGTAVVGVVTNKTISFGTPVVFNAAATKYTSICFDSNAGKVFIAYQDDANSDYATSVVGTVNPSNNSISFGSEVVIQSTGTEYTRCAFDSVNNKVVVVWKSDTSAGAAAVGTISGTSVTFGSIASFESGTVAGNSIVFHKKSGKVVIAYVDGGDSDNGKLIAGTVSGTSISFGSRHTFENGEARDSLNMVYDPNEEKIVLCWEDYVANVNPPTKLSVCDVEGTDVVVGGSQILAEGSTSTNKLAYVEDVKKIAVLMNHSNQGGELDGQLEFVEIIPNTMSLNITSSHIWNINPGDMFDIVYHPVQKNLFIPFRAADPYYGTALIFQHETHNSTMTSENFLGFSDAAYSNGQTAKIQIVGAIDDAQTGLTTGKKHYVQPSGGIGLTAYPTLQVEAGLALSGTKIIVKG